MKTKFTERRLRDHRLVPRSRFYTRGSHPSGAPFQMTDGRWYVMDRGTLRRLHQDDLDLLAKARDEDGVYPRQPVPGHPCSWDPQVLRLSRAGYLRFAGPRKPIPGPPDGPMRGRHVITAKGLAAIQKVEETS